MIGKSGGSWSQVLGAFSPGATAQKIARRALLGAGVLTVLLFWWSGWSWWPVVLWFAAPLVLVILPGIRSLVDETWGLVVGLLLAAVMLMPQVPGALVTLAWGLAVAAVAAVSFRRHRFGWRKWVPVAGAVLALVLIALGGLAWWAQAGARARDAEHQAAEAHRFEVSKTLPSSPRQAVLALVEAVSTADPQRTGIACGAFSPTAAATFAVAHQVADCPGAVAALHARVRSFDSYVNQVSIPSQAEVVERPGRVRLDACTLDFTNVLAGGDTDAGPQLGVLVLDQQYGHGWQITSYQPCRAQ